MEIRVLRVEPGRVPYEKQINYDLESIQSEVEGYIETVYTHVDTAVALIVNEEGKLEGLPYNRALRDEKGNIYDVIVGNFLIVGIMGEDFCSLTDNQVKRFKHMFMIPEEFNITKGKLVVHPMKDEDIKRKLQ